MHNRHPYYIIIWSKTHRLAPGDIIRLPTQNQGEILALTTIDPKTMQPTTTAIAIQIHYTTQQKLKQRLQTIKQHAEKYATIIQQKTGIKITPQQIQKIIDKKLASV